MRALDLMFVHAIVSRLFLVGPSGNPRSMCNKNQGAFAALPQACPENDAVDSGRRNFVSTASMVAVATTLGAVPLTAGAVGYSSSRVTRVPPARKRGSTVVSVLDYGARKDGTGDSTAAFQKAIDALPASGGTVKVPAGTYNINPDVSVKLRSKMLLDMSLNAKLVAIASSERQYRMFNVYRVDDVEIAGGRLVGDRYRHKGSTGEWGHGIYVRGCRRVTIRDIHLSDFWGDGISITAAAQWQAAAIPSEDVHVANVVSTNNRRQALTVGAVRTLKVYDSEFSKSNGTSPQCGIDIEPGSSGIAWNLLFENCHIHSNRAYGLLGYYHSRAITINNCTIEKNGSNGVVTNGAQSVYVANCLIRDNSATGMAVQKDTKGFGFAQNVLYRNYSRLGTTNRANPFSMKGLSPKVERDILVGKSARDVRVATNHYK